MSNARNLSKLIPSSTGLIQTANITDDAITNAKLADSETVLQVVANYDTTQTAYSGGSSSSGLDILDSGTITTKATNSQFIIMATWCYAFSLSNDNNVDNEDVHFACLRTYNTGSGTNHAYIGNQDNYNRNTGNAPTSNKFYQTDVHWHYNSSSEQHNGQYDVRNHPWQIFDNPSQAAGTTVQYRIRCWYEGPYYRNRATQGTGNGGTSSLIVMEIGAN
tara:strand:+ start:38 stop:694 length:657 start_codon:yes stop_codon:yes gene_type:complete